MILSTAVRQKIQKSYKNRYLCLHYVKKMKIFVCNTKYYKRILKCYVVKGVNLRLGKKSKLTDDRMIDSICTSDERLEDFLMEIGRRLKEERIKKGYSVSELSQLSGVAATIIYRIESSTNPVGLRSLLRLMWSLNVSPAQLIPFDEYAHSKTFGDVIEEMTSNLSPKQKQYLLKVIMTDIGFLNADSSLIKSDIEYSNGIIVENKK